MDIQPFTYQYRDNYSDVFRQINNSGKEKERRGRDWPSVFEFLEDIVGSVGQASIEDDVFSLNKSLPIHQSAPPVSQQTGA